MNTFDFSSLSDALRQLEEGLKEAEKNPQSMLLRDGVIQRFEYSHELAIKFIKRVLEKTYGDPVDALSYNDVLRSAAERGLIDDVEQWFSFRAARNKTSHTYDAAIAADVYRVAEPFLVLGTSLLRRLHELPH